MKQKGTLYVKVINDLTKNPVAFANVSVYFLTFIGLYGEHGEANLVGRHTTDEKGQIPTIELPVIDMNNQSTGTQYYLTVNHFRYHPVNLMNIQIYPNITTDYNINLTPITSPHPDYEFWVTPNLLK